MAATSLGQVVTSTLKVLAGYSYHTASDTAQLDPAYEHLQPLGGAAAALIEERNALRTQVTQLTEQLEIQGKCSQVYSAHLLELIRRVRTLDPRAAESLLLGIQSPQVQDASHSVLSLLQTVNDLQRSARSFTASGETSLALEDRVELPLINSYLDRALETARRSVETCSRLELSEEPTIMKAWPSIHDRLQDQLAEKRPLTEIIRIKAEALNALKTAESISMEEALVGSLRLKSRLESMICESESWVVTELIHERVNSTPELLDKITHRVELTAQPMTLSVLKELTDIYEDYEALRKAATLRPWIDRVQPEMEWWKLVSLMKQVVVASEENYKGMMEERGREWTLGPVLDRLQRESTIDNEGIYNFLYSLLEELRKLENLKHDCLSYRTRENPNQTLFDFLHSYLNFAMIFATCGNQPCKELLEINSELNKPGCEVIEVVRKLNAVTKGILAAGTQKVTERLSMNWVVPLLQKCLEVTDENDEDLSRISAELQYAQSARQEEEHTTHVESMGECITRTIEKMHYASLHQRELVDGELRVKEQDLEDLRWRVDNALRVLKDGCADLSGCGSQSLSAAAASLQRSADSAVEPGDKADALSAAISTLVTECLDRHDQLLENLKTTEEQVAYAVNAATSALQGEINAMLPALAALLEAVERTASVEECSKLMEREPDRAQPLALSTEKLRYTTQALTDIRTTLKSKLATTDNLTVIRKLKHALDLSTRNAEDLAKGSSDPDNEAKTREVVQAAKAKAVDGNIGELLDALTQVQEVEREQVTLRLSDDYREVEAIESSIVPQSPAKRLNAAAPAAQEKLEIGMDYLLHTVSSMLIDFNVAADDESHSVKQAEIAASFGVEKLLLQEALVHWELRELQAASRAALERRFERVQEMMGKVAGMAKDDETRRTIISDADLLRSQKDSGSYSLLAVDEEAEETLSAGLSAVAPHAAESAPSLRIPSPKAVVAPRPVAMLPEASDSSAVLINGVQRLLTAYNNELQVHNITFPCTAEEEQVMRDGDVFAQASVHLEMMEKALKTLSERAIIYKQDLKKTKDSIKPIVEVEMQTLRILSESDSMKYWTEQSPLESDIRKAMNGAVHIRDISLQIYEGLKKANGLLENQDITSQIDALIARLSHPSSEVVVSSEIGSSPPGAERKRLQGIPARTSPYTPLDNGVKAVAESAAAVLDLQQATALASALRTRAKVSLSEGDPMGILHSKLEIVKDALERFALDYHKSVAQPWTLVFDLSKANLQMAKGLMTDPIKQQQVSATLSQLSNRASVNKSELRDCCEEVQRKLQQVLEELSPAEEEGESQPLRKRLSAAPAGEDRSVTHMLELADQMVRSLCIAETPQLQEELRRVEAASGKEKTTLQQALLQKKLQTMLDAMHYHFQSLISRIITQIRTLGKAQGKSDTLETEMEEIESNISENGANISMLEDVEGVLEALIAEATQGESSAVDSAQSPRPKLSSVSSSADRVAKGQSFIIRDLELLAEALSLQEDAEKPARCRQIQEADGQDKVIMQQALMHSELKRMLAQLESTFSNFFQRLIADIRNLSGQKGVDMSSVLSEIERAAQIEGVHATTLFDLFEVLEARIESVPEATQAEDDKQRTRLSAVAKGGDKVGKGLDYLMGMVGDVMLLLGVSGGDPERLSALAQLDSLSGQEKLFLQQNLIYRDLKVCHEKLTIGLQSSLAHLHSLSSKLAPLVPSDSDKQAFTAAYQRVKNMARGAAVTIEQVVEAANLMDGLSLSHGDFVETDVREAAAAHEEPAQKKLSAVPNASEKLALGMGKLLREAGLLLAKLECEPDEEVAEQLQEIEAATGQEKVFLQQALVRSQLITAQEELHAALARTLERLAKSLLSFSISEEQLHIAQSLEKVIHPKFSHVATALKILVDNIGQAIAYEETEEPVITEEALESERTKLSSVPSASDKVAKGLEFLMKDAKRLLVATHVEIDVREDLENIARATGQDKVLMQQNLLHKQLQAVFIAVNRDVGEGFEEATGSVESVQEEHRTRLSATTADENETIGKLSLSVVSAFHAELKPEAMKLLETLKTALGVQKPKLYKKLTLHNLTSLKEKAIALQNEQQAEAAERTSVNTMVMRLKTSMESMLGQEFAKEWARVINSSLSEKLKTIAGSVDKLSRMSPLKDDEISRLLPSLRALELPEIASRLSAPVTATSTLETASAALQLLQAMYQQVDAHLQWTLTETQQMVASAGGAVSEDYEAATSELGSLSAGIDKLNLQQRMIEMNLLTLKESPSSSSADSERTLQTISSSLDLLRRIVYKSDSACSLLAASFLDSDSQRQISEFSEAAETTHREFLGEPKTECLMRMLGVTLGYAGIGLQLAAKLYGPEGEQVVMEMQEPGEMGIEEWRKTLRERCPQKSGFDILEEKLGKCAEQGITGILALTSDESAVAPHREKLAVSGLSVLASIMNKISALDDITAIISRMNVTEETSTEAHSEVQRQTTVQVIDPNSREVLAETTEVVTENLPVVEVPPADPAPEEVPPADQVPEEVPPADPAPEELPPVDPAPEELPPADPAPEELPPADPAPEELPPADPAPEELPPADSAPEEVPPPVPVEEAPPSDVPPAEESSQS